MLENLKQRKEERRTKGETMSLPFTLKCVLSVLCLCLLQTQTFAVRKAYIVYLGSQPFGLRTTNFNLESVTNSHYNLLGSFLGNVQLARESMLYSYTQVFNGFAALFEESLVDEIASHPSVISVFESKGRKLHTTHSWEFMGLEKAGQVPPGSLWTKARFGEDVIIGNLDTGVWPESRSFNDEGMGPVPTRWRGICQRGLNDSFTCNRKLIGARFFNKGYEAYVGKLNATYHTPRDHGGHGTHTLSTAGGSFVPGVNVFGIGNGTASGGSPKARVAAYRVCYPPIDDSECFDADILAGYDAAVADGVDVLSVSLGGFPSEYLMDGIAIGSFHAVKEGVIVVASAGNSGPLVGSVSNVAPWMFTIGASTLDREFSTMISLGNKMHLKGTSLSEKGLPVNKFYPLVNARDAGLAGVNSSESMLCKPKTLDPAKVKGSILVCLRGDNNRVEKGVQALLAGAVGMILANTEDDGNDVISDAHVLAAAHLTYKDGQTLYAYLNSTKTPDAYMTHVRTVLDTKPAPFIASFSSRGPNIIDPFILKPDITAPGVNIIAAYSEAVSPTNDDSDHRRVPYLTESGTSMSCPHVSGLVGLIKSAHPDWSPAAIRSALMTTAKTRDNTRKTMLTASFEKATPFDYGAGHVHPNSAIDPGLVYDLTIDDYLNYLCGRGYNESVLKLFTKDPHQCAANFSLASFNYPSIQVLELNTSITLTRRLKNVGTPGTYVAKLRPPPGVSITVQPTSLTFDKIGEEKVFTMVIKSRGPGQPADFVFGTLTWSDGKHRVKSNIAVQGFKAWNKSH